MADTPYIDVTDIRDAEAVVVVVVSWAGRSWRLGEREVTFAAGEHVLPGLVEVPEITDEVDLSGGGGDSVSVSFACVLPCEDVPALIAAGFDLIDATAEVSIVWHRAGAAVHTWKANHVVAKGDLVASHYRALDQPPGWLSTTLEDSPYRREVPLVPRTAEITAETWPTSTEAAGTRIPWVVGAPGADAEVSAPIAVVTAGNTDRVIVSSGYSVATQVNVLDSTGTSYTGGITYSTADGLGQTFASVDTTGAPALWRTQGPYTSAWVDPAHVPFGSVSASPVLLAADLLARGGADIDLPEWVRVGTYLGGQCAGYIDDPDARAWEVARDLISWLPIAIHRGDCGWAPVILDPHNARERSVAVVREGEDWRRVSQWQTEEGTARVTRVEATWSGGSATVGAGTAYDGPLPHGWVRHLPRGSTASLSLEWGAGDATAYRAAAWLARSQALGWRVSAWQVPASRSLVRAGEWVTLIDSAGATSYAIVIRRTLSGGIWDYALAVPGGL